MKKYLFIVCLLSFCAAVFCPVDAIETVESPSLNLKACFDIRDGRPVYWLLHKGDTVIRPSYLGMQLRGEHSRGDFNNYKEESKVDSEKSKTEVNGLMNGFVLIGSERYRFDETWQPVWGEERSIRNRYNEMLVTLKQPDKDRSIQIQFRLYDDGLGFRYIFPQQRNLNYFVIEEERTEFAMPGDITAYWIPGDYDTQEYEYTRCRLSEIRGIQEKTSKANLSTTNFSLTGVQTPILLRTDSGLWVNIHEAALMDYSCMHLNLNDHNMVFTSWLTPSPPTAAI